MEINHYGDIILGGVPQEDIVEGRLVLLTTNVHSRNYGSQQDLPGAKMPTTQAEAGRARYVVMFEQDNRGLPLYQPQPAFSDVSAPLRYGFDQAANAPFSATVYLTHPGVQEGLTIPSGGGCLLFGSDSIMTVPSGAFVYSAELHIPGMTLAAADTASDSAGVRGKLHYSTTEVVAEVVRYDSTNNKLTFRML